MLVEEMDPVMQNSFKRALVHAKLSVVPVFFWTVQHVQSPISSSISKGQNVSCTYSKLEEGFISSYFLSVFFLRSSGASVLGDFSFSWQRTSCIWLFKADLYLDAIPPVQRLV